jgi:hypothetical protein
MSGALQPGGDPFAAAYARANGQTAAAQADQLVLGRQAALAQRDRFAGYGFPGTEPSCPSSPDDTIAECIRAGREVLEGTIQLHELVPWTVEPFRAHSTNQHIQAVLSTTAAFNAAINAAGLLLRTANTVGTDAPALLEMASAGEFMTLFEIQPPQTFMARIKSWGLSAGPAGPKVVQVRLRAATVGGSPTPPNQFLSSYPVNQQEPVFALLQPDQALRVDVRMIVLTAPVLLDFGICTYHWPVGKRKDTPKGAILRSGYGQECNP